MVYYVHSWWSSHTYGTYVACLLTQMRLECVIITRHYQIIRELLPLADTVNISGNIDMLTTTLPQLMAYFRTACDYLLPKLSKRFLCVPEHTSHSIIKLIFTTDILSA